MHPFIINLKIKIAQWKFQWRENKTLRFGKWHMGMMSQKEGTFLYNLVKKHRPGVVVETGVCNGVSTWYTLQAMHDGGSGHLYSIDWPAYRFNVEDIIEAAGGTKKATRTIIPDGFEPGWLVPDACLDRWDLIIGSSRRKLPALLEKLKEIDVFIHDSDHSYKNITWELETAFPYVKPRGFLIVDDFKRNLAVLDFCRRHNKGVTYVDGIAVIQK